MKLKVNETVRLTESGDRVLARLPNGFQARLAKDMMPLIRAFETAGTVAEVRAAIGGSIDDFDARIAKLQDLVILVPDDTETYPWPLPFDLLIDGDPRFRDILRQIRGYTMSTPELCYALFLAVEHLRTGGVPGAIVESGVWRGGNVALCARTLLIGGDTSRDLYLFDTFDWSWPDLSLWDTKYGEGTAAERNAALKQRRDAPLDVLDAHGVSETKVRDFLCATGYPSDKVHTVKGLVQGDGARPRARDHRLAQARHRHVRLDLSRAGPPLSATGLRRHPLHRRLSDRAGLREGGGAVFQRNRAAPFHEPDRHPRPHRRQALTGRPAGGLVRGRPPSACEIGEGAAVEQLQVGVDADQVRRVLVAQDRHDAAALAFHRGGPVKVVAPLEEGEGAGLGLEADDRLALAGKDPADARKVVVPAWRT